MALKYEVPPEYAFTLHHVRPRFKDDIENVLIYMATEIAALPELRKRDFQEKMDEAIIQYPGNASKKLKTIRNWRTEISSLFGLIEYNTDAGVCYPGAVAANLSDKQDLREFFRYFAYYFQYPGAHLKPRYIAECIEKGVRFKPAKYLLSLLKEAEETTGKPFYINKAEATYCVFNDLRVTSAHQPAGEIIRLIRENRQRGAGYDWDGDTIRYAGDILDYMVIADLLKNYAGKYYLNHNAEETVRAFIQSNEYFSKYDALYGQAHVSLSDVNPFYDDWFRYVNGIGPVEQILRTNICVLINDLEEKRPEYAPLKKAIRELFRQPDIRTKEIGDIGENLVHQHELARLKSGGREDLLSRVRVIPNSFSVGYDIHSVELNEKPRHIEVKSTISRGSIRFNTFQMTRNEWMVAEDYDGSYFVYRLMFTEDDIRLFVIRDPVGKYKSNQLRMEPGQPLIIKFQEKAGNWEELLVWEN